MKCPCGEEASDTLAITSNIHEWHCATCTLQWAVVKSAISAMEGRHWKVADLRRWQDQKRRAA